MDPLSITASCIAVAALAAQTCSAFAQLRSICKTLPGRLHAINNEVADIEVVCYQVAAVLDERVCLPPLGNETTNAHIRQLLRQTNAKLRELKGIVDQLTTTCDRSKVTVFAAQAWKKKQRRLHALQEDIKTAKCTLNIMLGASNSRDMMRIRLDLETISTVTSQSAQGQNDLRYEFLGSLSQHQNDLRESVSQMYHQVDQRIGRVEEILRAQSERLEASQYTQLGPLKRRAPRIPNKGSEFPKLARSEGVGVRVTQFAIACRPGCPCACHSQGRSVTPALIDRVLGRLFVGYAGLPFLSPKCDSDACEKAQIPHVSLEYWFPLGFFWSQIISFQIANASPQMQLSFLRRVPDSAQCVDFALDGNIEGLKDLFKRGLASPRDVSSTRGYSVLRWAVYGKQWETSKFLVHAGADPDYRPIGAYDNSPRNKASDFVLQGFLSKEEVETLGCLTAGSDWVENQNFTPIHKIVTGLSLLSLEEEILLHPDDIDAADAMGRTPLTWAAARGDDRAVATLLSQGADPNTLDIQWTGPVSYAAERGHLVCLRLLLEAGAQPDPHIPDGLKIGSPLNCAARNSSNALVLKTLLDFGAETEASGVDGKTSLIHVARTDNIKFAMLLLEYGADINAPSITGLTPLTTAITYNSHSVLRLLLDRWVEYSICPRLQGPNLLETAALFADVETLKILTATDHFKLNYDKDYILANYGDRLLERFDVTDELIKAFQDLVSIISTGPEMAESAECLLEAGLLRPYRDSPCERTGSEKSSDHGSDVCFEDALECLQPAPHDDESDTPISSLI
ncbi:MAG: hypothetical protein M1840_008788 [Geoglossum simile]|nr:MAG: hypothetical protein M1840_008788 [Geoglossum simile]